MSLQTKTGTRNVAGVRLTVPLGNRRYPGRIVLFVVALACASLARADLKVGDPFPSLAAPGMAMLGGGDLPATAGKVMLVDFWASWCAPCKASFPALGKIHADFSRRGLLIAAVGVDEKLADAVQFVRTLRPPFVTLHDREQHLVKQVVVPGMPTTYLVGRDGRVRFMHQGYHGAETDKLLRQQIETLLAEKSQTR
jgi:thiol-disulfide isomerase/thioredoxin